MECTQQASQMCQPREYHYNIEYLMAITIDIMSLWIPSLRNPSSINHCTCQVRNGSYAGWLISSWWCTPHIFCMASSCSLTICIIINSMIPVPYILLYSYLHSIYYFRMRINLTKNSISKTGWIQPFQEKSFYKKPLRNSFKILKKSSWKTEGAKIKEINLPIKELYFH